MAVYVQPYNPWREQLAAGIIAPLLGDFLTNMRQNEQNRKTNAFRGALQDALSSQSQPVSLTPQNVPEGYNSNPWASAFHKSDTPLTQFDLGTSALTPKTPSIQDIAQSVDSLAASKRFSMLNPDAIDKIRNQHMQRAYADMFGNATDAGAQMRALAMGTAEGVVPHQALYGYSQFARDEAQPWTFSDMDIGSHKLRIANNAKDGTASPVVIAPVGMSPYQSDSLQNARDIAQIGSDTTMRGQNLNYETENRRLDIADEQAQWERANPERQVIQDSEGTYYSVPKRGGNAGKATTVADEDGYSIAGDTGKNPALSAAVKSIDLELKDLREQKNRIMIAYDEREREAMLAPIRERETELITQRDNLIKQLLPQGRENRRKIPTIAEVAASAASGDVLPTVASQDAKPAPKVVPMGTDSGDVAPEEPRYIPSASMWNSARPGKYRNISQDISAPAQQASQEQPASHSTAQKKSAPSQAKLKDFDVPDEMAYDPVRDKDMDRRLLFTPKSFRDYIRDLRTNPKYGGKYAKYSVQQLILAAYRAGHRIKQ